LVGAGAEALSFMWRAWWSLAERMTSLVAAADKTSRRRRRRRGTTSIRGGGEEKIGARLDYC